jgi:hypothetical protein
MNVSISIRHFPIDLEQEDDRLSPSVAGGMVGFVAGPVALSVARLVSGAVIAAPIARAADARGVSAAVSLGIAYVTAAALGALAGGLFGVVTRHLRKWFPLLLWGGTFFVCLGIISLTTSIAAGRYLHGGDVAPELSIPVLLGALVFGLLVSFSLPIRSRR